MKNKAHDLLTYPFSVDEPLLLDTNIWLYLFPAPSSPPHGAPIKKYSAAFGRMRNAKVRLTMDVLVLGEYINRYCRIEYKAGYAGTYPDYKKFRQSRDFKSVGQGAAVYARKILSFCTAFDHPFSSANLKDILVDFEDGLADVNDGLIAGACRNNGWKLVTNDGDFVNGGIEVLTANNRLLSACP